MWSYLKNNCVKLCFAANNAIISIFLAINCVTPVWQPQVDVSNCCHPGCPGAFITFVPGGIDGNISFDLYRSKL